jgi:hypothetical protein
MIKKLTKINNRSGCKISPNLATLSNFRSTFNSKSGAADENVSEAKVIEPTVLTSINYILP